PQQPARSLARAAHASLLPFTVVAFRQFLACDRQQHAERRTNTWVTFHPNASMLRFRQSFGNGQTHAGISNSLNQDIVRAIEAGKDPWKVLGRDATTFVGNLDEDEFRTIFGSRLDLEFDRALKGSRRSSSLQ